MINTNSATIPVFPIYRHTVIGVQSDTLCGKFNVVHANEDGDVTFTFLDDTTLDVTVTGGDDLGITQDVKSLSSSAEVMLS